MASHSCQLGFLFSCGPCGTLGIREKLLSRYVLSRKTETVSTPYGPVRKKVGEGYGTERWKYEYEDLARIARENQLSLEELKRL